MRWEIEEYELPESLGKQPGMQPVRQQGADAVQTEGVQLDDGLRAEQLVVRLAGCSVAALGWNGRPAVPGDYGYSVAYQDVLNLRRKYEYVLQKYLDICRETGRPMSMPGV